MKTIWDFWANKYDKLWVQKYSLTPTRNEIIKIIKDEKQPNTILDMGCGTGQLTRELSDICPSADIVGVDYSSEMISIAKENAKNAGKNKLSYFNDSVDTFIVKEKVNIVTCSHSFPYYKNKKDAFKFFSESLVDGGLLLLAQASENSFYDKLCMLGVKTTTTKAKYLSIEELKDLSKDLFITENIIKIKEKWYMPTIIVMKMRKK